MLDRCTHSGEGVPSDGPPRPHARAHRRTAARRLLLAACLIAALAAAGCALTEPKLPPPPAGEARYELRFLDATGAGNIGGLARPDAGADITAALPARLDVVLHVRGGDDGISDFSVPPDWGGIQHLGELLHDLSFRSEDGAPLQAEALGERGWRVTHAPGAPLVASWWLGGELPPLDARIGNEYRPQISASTAHVMGSAGLLRPDALADGEPHRFELRWRGLHAPDQRAVCSFGEGAVVVAHETLDDFCNAVFLGGALRVLERPVGDGRLLLALAGGPMAFRDDDLADLAARIIASERSFFDDPGDPLFVVTLVPAPAPDARSISLGGTGLTRSFALFVSPHMSLTPGSDDAMRLSALLAHEHLHHWNGAIARGGAPEGSSYWFSEGFTDFYTRRLLLRDGTWSVAQLAAAWNETLAAWWTNPAREAPNARIVSDFWSDRDVGQLPYQRGSLAAQRLDREIRRTSDGRRSLDDFMREVVADGRAGEPASTERLLQRVADETSPAFADELRAFVVDGAPFTPDADFFAPALTLEWVMMRLGSHDATPVRVPRLTLAPGLDEASARAQL